MAATTCWAITRYDDTIGENRVIDIYTDAADANADAITLQGAGGWVEVIPWLIHNAPQYGSGEPVTEQTDADFDTVVEA